MKIKYEAPKLTVHGTVEDMTQFFGPSTAADTVFFGTTPFGAGFGSTDGQIIPR
ncbi:MAG: lasso peptide [Betaproteobacteria bacterium]